MVLHQQPLYWRSGHKVDAQLVYPANQGIHYILSLAAGWKDPPPALCDRSYAEAPQERH
jgi:hypothetical protein